MIKISAPNKSIKTEIDLSGSKSLSNRLLMIRAVSGMNLHFKNLSDSDDTITMAKELGQLAGKNNAVIDVGNAGTDMRFITAYLSTIPGEWVITGSDRMQQRPIGELVETLKKMGAEIKYEKNEGFPPLIIKGKKLLGGEVEIDGSVSSQFITALLLIAPSLQNGLTLIIKNETVSKPYIQMTLEVMKQFGITLTHKENRIAVSPSAYKKDGLDYYVESDWSSASYWYAVTALAKEADIKLNHFNKLSLQSDSLAAPLFERLGVQTEWSAKGIHLTKIPVNSCELNYDFIDCPDLAQTVAATCVGLGISANLIGLQTLKLKESDRILAMKNELEKFGAKIDVTDSSIIIQPAEKILIPSCNIETYHDHRMAMSIAPLALKAGELAINNPDVVNKSYAAFWDDLQEAGFEIG